MTNITIETPEPIDLSNYFYVVDKLCKPVDVTDKLKEGETLSQFVSTFLKHLIKGAGCHWMIDSETLGLTTAHTLVQMAAVPFSPIGTGLYVTQFRGVNGISLVHKANLDIKSQERLISADTLNWWYEKNTSNIHLLQDGKTTLLEEILILRKFLNKDSEIWANSPSFDVELLKNCFSQYQPLVGDWPVSYRNEWDVRTASKMAGINRAALERMYPECNRFWGMKEGTAHDALNDCLTQVYQVQLAYRNLQIGTKKTFKQTTESTSNES